MPLIGFALEEMRTSLFFYESLLQLVFVYPCRRIVAVPPSNVWIHLAVGFGVALQVLAVVAAPFGKLLGLVPVNATVLGTTAAIVVLTWTIAEFFSNGTRMPLWIRSRVQGS